MPNEEVIPELRKGSQCTLSPPVSTLVLKNLLLEEMKTELLNDFKHLIKSSGVFKFYVNIAEK